MITIPDPSQVSESDLVEAEAHVGKDSLYYFTQNILRIGEGSPFSRPRDEIEPICAWLQKPRPAHLGKEGRWKRFLALPRGTAKTSLVQAYAAWRVVKNPNLTVFFTSEEKHLSLDSVSHIMGYLSSPRIESRYGKFKGDTNWRPTQGKFTVVGRTMPRKEPTMMVGGVDVSSQGRHYDLIIADDLQGKTNITPEGIAKVKDYLRLLWPILNPGGELIWICTRWDFEDVANDILREIKQDPNSWDHLGDRGYFGCDAWLGDEEVFPHAKLNEPLFPSILPREELEALKQTMTPYHFSCNPAGAPVLMSDWSEKPIERIKVGDEVVGFSLGTSIGKQGKLVKSMVTAIGQRKAHVVKIRMSSGRVIRCTPDHKWYTGRLSKGRHTYAPAKMSKKGGPSAGTSKLFNVYEPGFLDFLNDAHNWGYLAGMIDGEGAVKYGALQISQSRKHHPGVCDRIEYTLKELGLKYTIWEDSKREKSALVYTLSGGRDLRRSLLEFGRPGKKDDILKAMWRSPGKPFNGTDHVVSIQYDGEEMVYSFQTTSGNYVVWGYGSKNCQYENHPLPSTNAYFKVEDLQHVPEYDLENAIFQGLTFYMGVDPASGTQGVRRGDDTAIVVIGVKGERSSRSIYVMDAMGGQWKPKQILEQIDNLNEKWRPRKIALETTGPGKFFLAMLKEWMRSETKYLPIKEVTHAGTTETKADRIARMEPLYRSHSVFHVQHLKNSKLEMQLMRFLPGGATHDDYPDALAMATEIIKEGHMTKRQLRVGPSRLTLVPRYKSTGY